MAKKDIKDLLGKKSPGELRRGIQQIDILKEASEALSSPKKEDEKTDDQIISTKEPDKPDDKTVEEEQPASSIVQSGDKKTSELVTAKKRSKKVSQKTERENRSTSRRKPKVFSSKDVQAILELDKRATERYSFEIYSDQKDDIERVCELYAQATGNKLSASRLIREVLDTFLPDALKTFESSARESPEE